MEPLSRVTWINYVCMLFTLACTYVQQHMHAKTTPFPKTRWYNSAEAVVQFVWLLSSCPDSLFTLPQGLWSAVSALWWDTKLLKVLHIYWSLLVTIYKLEATK